MKYLFISLALACSLSACSTGNSNGLFAKGEPVSSTIVSKQVSVSEFTELEVCVPAKVTYSAGPESLSVSAPDNVMDYLQFKIKDGELEISLKEDAPQFCEDMKINIYLSSATLEKLELHSASWFSAKAIDVDKLKCEIYGASKLNVESITSPAVDFEIAGASNVKIGSIETSTADFDIAGASNVAVGRLTAVDADVEVMGASNAKFADLMCNKLDTEAGGASYASFTDIEVTILKGEAVGASRLILSGSAHTANLEAYGASNIKANSLSCTHISNSAGGSSTISR